MPEVVVVIDGSKKLTWYLGGNQMEKVIGYLDRVGVRDRRR